MKQTLIKWGKVFMVALSLGLLLPEGISSGGRLFCMFVFNFTAALLIKEEA